MKLNTPFKISVFISLILVIYALICYLLFPLLNVIISSFLFFTFSFITIYYIIKYQFYQRIKVIYKNIYKFKGTSNINDLNLDNADKEAQEWADQKEEELAVLQKDENYRREFIGNVSHELKTPIFNIQGYIHTLIDGALYDKNVNMAYLERTSKSVDRMINIVEDLVTISKIESDRLDLEMENFDIVDLAKDIFDQTEMKAKKANLSISLDKEYDPISVLADRDKIIQVFTNLVVNSIKYGKEGGETKVRFYEMGENILIEVADNGIGISQQNLPRLFERFYRVDKSRSRDQGGTGLGLAIVKHILESHNQVINVRSTEDVGTTFSFTLQKS